ncbi:hypothetical protein ACLMJK_006075 [Lecanora helva]
MATTVSSKLQTLLAKTAETSNQFSPPPTMPQMRVVASQNGGTVGVYYGMTHLTDDGVRAEAKERTLDAAVEIDAMTFGCALSDAFEALITEDVRRLRAEKVLKGVEIRGMALHTFTGVVREVVVG